MSKKIKITNYESLLLAAKQQAEPQRLLFVFLRTSLPENYKDEEANRFYSGRGGELQPIMCVDKTLDELGSFSDLVEESKQMEQDWHIVLVAGLSGRNGILPDSSEADQPLKVMVQTVEIGGDLSKYAAFDREGTSVQFG
jgi:hypothetical protein